MAGQSGDWGLSHSLSDGELLEGGHHLHLSHHGYKKSRALTSLAAILTKDIFIINYYLLSTLLCTETDFFPNNTLVIKIFRIFSIL